MKRLCVNCEYQMSDCNKENNICPEWELSMSLFIALCETFKDNPIIKDYVNNDYSKYGYDDALKVFGLIE